MKFLIQLADRSLIPCVHISWLDPRLLLHVLCKTERIEVKKKSVMAFLSTSNVYETALCRVGPWAHLAWYCLLCFVFSLLIKQWKLWHWECFTIPLLWITWAISTRSQFSTELLMLLGIQRHAQGKWSIHAAVFPWLSLLQPPQLFSSSTRGLVFKCWE